MRLYIDGIEVATTSVSGKITYHSTCPWEIGGNPGPTAFGAGNISGKFNDIRMYDHCISESDVKRLSLSKTYEVVEGDNMLFERCGLSTGGTQEYNLTYSPGIIKLNGSNSALKVPFNNLQKGTFSMNVWFLRKEFGSDSWETIFGGPSGFELESKPSTSSTCNIVAYSWGGNSASKYIPYTLNEWNMLTMTRTTGNTKFYLNGVLKYTGSAGSVPTGDYFIGAWSNYNGQNFKGNVSKFSIYSKELSASEIQFLYDNEKGHILPDEYEQLEYIESNGTQWIDTLVSFDNPSATYKFDCKLAASTRNGNAHPFFGTDSYTTGMMGIYHYTNNTYYGVYITKENKGAQGISITSGSVFEYYLEMNLSSNTVISKLATTNKITQSFKTMTDTTSHITIFKGSGYSIGYWKCYRFSISINGLFVRDFIPAKRKSDNVIGMYDIASGRFFTNSGSGSFTGA